MSDARKDIDEVMERLRALLRGIVANEQQKRHARAVVAALVRMMEEEG